VRVILRPEEIFGTTRDATFVVDRNGRFQWEYAGLRGYVIQGHLMGDESNAPRSCHPERTVVIFGESYMFLRDDLSSEARPKDTF